MWPFGDGETKEPGAPPRLVKASELPLYPEEKERGGGGEIRFVEEPRLPGETAISASRETVEATYNGALSRYATLRNAADSTQQSIDQAKNFLRADGDVMPKAGAITVGGMAGYLLGMKRGGLPSRFFYTSLGLGLTAAFCYPYETMDFSRNAYGYMHAQWKEMNPSSTAPTKSEAPKSIELVDPAPSNTSENKDMEMYTTRSKTIQ